MLPYWGVCEREQAIPLVYNPSFYVHKVRLSTDSNENYLSTHYKNAEIFFLLMWGFFFFFLWKCIPFNCSFQLFSIAKNILDVNLKSINFKDEKSNYMYPVNFTIFLYIKPHNKTQNLDPSCWKPHVLSLIFISFLLIKCREKYPQIKV